MVITRILISNYQNTAHFQFSFSSNVSSSLNFNRDQLSVDRLISPLEWDVLMFPSINWGNVSRRGDSATR